MTKKKLTTIDSNVIIKSDSFDGFIAHIQNNIDNEITTHTPLFHTNVSKDILYATYLGSFTTEQSRAEHTCRHCETFIKNYGDLVYVDEDGKLHSVLWDKPYKSELFSNAVSNLNRLVTKSTILEMFDYSNYNLGHGPTWAKSKTILWTHFNIKLDSIISCNIRQHFDRYKSDSQNVAEKTQNVKNVLTAIKRIKVPTLEKAVALLKVDALRDSEKVLIPAEWLLQLIYKIGKHKGDRRLNIIWREVVLAPNGFCHPSSSMINTLIEDIDAGLPFEEYAEKFRLKMDPLYYQRPTAKPSFATIKQAESIIADLNLEDSLKRKPATIDDLVLTWSPKVVEKEITARKGIFDNLKLNLKSSDNKEEINKGKITFRYFREHILPDALSMQLYIPSSHYNFIGFTTAEIPNSTPILKYDRLDNRNEVCTYMHSNGALPYQFNMLNNSFVDVIGLTGSPEDYDKNNNIGSYEKGQAVFLLKDCRDITLQITPLFPPSLIKELFPVRSVIEEYARITKMIDVPNAVAGVFIATGGGHVKLKVETKDLIISCTIDRWE